MRLARVIMAWVFCFVGMLALCGGCSGARGVDPEVVRRVRAEAVREFERGAYYKPGDHGMVGVEGELLPLMIFERAEEEGQDDGVKVCTPVGDGGSGCDAGRATVYSSVSEARVGEVSLAQVVYVWFCADGGGARGMGVRVVMGPDGFPMVWEGLEERSEVRAVYVSRSLEDLASEQFGGALAGRAFAVERGAGEGPAAIVVRVLDDGPMPMGPWVYVSGSGELSTVICRCMPSQVNEIVTTTEYSVEPVEAIGAGRFAEWALRVTGDADLTEVLRWPMLAGLVTDSGSN